MNRSECLTLPARAESLQAATEFVRRGAAEARLPEDRLGHLDLITEEIVMNISWHAYPKGVNGEFTIQYAVPAEGELRVEIADQGNQFDPLAAAPPDLNLDVADRPVGRLGIFLIRAFTDSLSYRRENGWNRVAFSISSGQ
jgi:anti-sigma regulatory factor (Ser/Thr protein kinase)